MKKSSLKRRRNISILVLALVFTCLVVYLMQVELVLQLNQELIVRLQELFPRAVQIVQRYLG